MIDEAHHVAGSSDEVARHQLGRRLAESVPRILLLSATPHSGKSDAFARLLGLLDDGFLHGRPVLRKNVAPLVVRTEKSDATDASGRPLFRPRTTSLMTVPYGQRSVERSLYESVSDYVRHGYRRARAGAAPPWCGVQVLDFAPFRADECRVRSARSALWWERQSVGEGAAPVRGACSNSTSRWRR